MTALEIEQKKIIEKQKEQIVLMRKLATTEGFFQHYFSILKQFDSQPQCFNHVNDLYFDLFNEYRYSCYNSFRNTLKRIYKHEK